MTYATVFIRQVMEQNSQNIIILILTSRFNDLITDTVVARKVIAFVNLNMSKNDFMLDSDESFAALNTYYDCLVELADMQERNRTIGNSNPKNLDYGLVPTQPIYTIGVRGSNTYLASLKTPTGNSLNWKRQGSMNVEGVNGLVDVYNGYLTSGELYKTLYINMYGSKNSRTAPSGFIISE